MSYQFDQEFGVRKETVDGTSVINDTTKKPLRAGLLGATWGMYPQTIKEVMAHFQGGSYDAHLLEVVKNAYFGEFGYIPTDSYLWYLAYGGGDAYAGLTDFAKPPLALAILLLVPFAFLSLVAYCDKYHRCVLCRGGQREAGTTDTAHHTDERSLTP